MIVKSADKNIFKKFKGILSSGNLKEELNALRSAEVKSEDRKLKLHKTAKTKK